MSCPTAVIFVDGRRKIVNADDPRVKDYGQEAVEEGRAQEMTRADIYRMKRAEVIGMLTAHGVREEDCVGVILPALRERLTRIMFVGL